MKPVYLTKPDNLFKVRLLSPFVPRYRRMLSIQKLPVQARQIVRDTLVSNDGKLVYVKNSKAANTTVGSQFFFWQNGRFPEKNIHQQSNNIKQGLRAADDIVNALVDPKSYKFTFVRDPMTRTVSAFKDFFVEQRNISRKNHAPFIKAFGLKEGNSVSQNFDTYLDYVEACFDANSIQTDQHFRAQVHNTAFGTIKFDFIGKVESLEADIAYLEEHLGLPSPTKARDKAMTVRNKSGASFTPNAAQKTRIRELYAEDFDAFDY